jgi:hypothetical protein
MSFIILSNDFNLDAYAHVFLKANFKAQTLENLVPYVSMEKQNQEKSLTTLRMRYHFD